LVGSFVMSSSKGKEIVCEEKGLKIYPAALRGAETRTYISGGMDEGGTWVGEDADGSTSISDR